MSFSILCRSEGFGTMTAHRAFEIGVGILLVSFLAGANAGMRNEK